MLRKEQRGGSRGTGVPGREVDCNFRYCGQGKLLRDDVGVRTFRLDGGTILMYQGTRCSSRRTGSRKGWARVLQAQQGAPGGWSPGRRGQQRRGEK